MITSLLDWLESISSGPGFYPLIFLISLFDSVVPAVPSETTVILGGIAAGRGDLSFPLVVVLGAGGAFAGDNVAYWLGRRSGGFIERRLFRSAKGKRRLEWATEQLRTRGGLLLITARFIPGGRTAITISSGLTQQPYGRFVAFDALACVLWAGYAGTLGFVAGDRFKDDHTTAFFAAFGAALSVTVLIEAVRWVRHRRTDAPDPT